MLDRQVRPHPAVPLRHLRPHERPQTEQTLARSAVQHDRRDPISRLRLPLAVPSPPTATTASAADTSASGPGFQRLLRDIEAGLIAIDLIVVDTLERLGTRGRDRRAPPQAVLDYGILVVAADNNFADPTGIVGKAVGMVEQIRSTENTRDLRPQRHPRQEGRRPARPLARRAPPLRLPAQARRRRIGHAPDVYNVLEPEPREAAALRLAFQRADETGEGAPRLSQWWNDHPDIPDDSSRSARSPWPIG